MAIFGNDKSADAGVATSSRKEPLRFRLYYRLMDLALVVYLVALAMAISVALSGTDPSTFPLIIQFGVPVIVAIVVYLILPVLIVASKLRDEYAELLWKRTVSQLTVLAVLLPPIVSAILWFVFLVVLKGDPEANWGGNRPDWLMDPIYAEDRRLYVVLDVWSYYTFGFVLLFQFNRWRDSRAPSE